MYEATGVRSLNTGSLLSLLLILTCGCKAPDIVDSPNGSANSIPKLPLYVDAEGEDQATLSSQEKLCVQYANGKKFDAHSIEKSMYGSNPSGDTGAAAGDADFRGSSDATGAVGGESNHTVAAVTRDTNVVEYARCMERARLEPLERNEGVWSRRSVKLAPSESAIHIWQPCKSDQFLYVHYSELNGLDEPKSEDVMLTYRCDPEDFSGTGKEIQVPVNSIRPPVQWAGIKDSFPLAWIGLPDDLLPENNTGKSKAEYIGTVAYNRITKGPILCLDLKLTLVSDSKLVDENIEHPWYNLLYKSFFMPENCSYAGYITTKGLIFIRSGVNFEYYFAGIKFASPSGL
jgi:hypothetical protein